MKQPYDKKVSHYNADPFKNPYRSSRYKPKKPRLKSKKPEYNDPIPALNPYIPAAPLDSKKLNFATLYGGKLELEHTKPQTGMGKTLIIGHGQQSDKFKPGYKVTFNGQEYVVADVKTEPIGLEAMGVVDFMSTEKLSQLHEYMKLDAYHTLLMQGMPYMRATPKTIEEKADDFLEDPDNKGLSVKELAVSFARQQLDEQADVHRDVERRLDSKMGQYRTAYWDVQKDVASLQARVVELERQLERNHAQRSTIIAGAIMETSRTRLFRE